MRCGKPGQSGPSSCPMLPSSQDEAGQEGARVPAPTREAPLALRVPGGRARGRGGQREVEAGGKADQPTRRVQETHTRSPGPSRRGEAAGFPQDAPWREHIYVDSGFRQASVSTQEVTSEVSGMTKPSGRRCRPRGAK